MKLLLEDLVLSLPFVGAFAVFGIGIVVTYQSSRVLNLAHGAMAMSPGYVAYALSRHGVPPAGGVVTATVVGAVLGVGVERFVLRPLRTQGPAAQTVGTVAVLGLLIAVAGKIFGSAPVRLGSVFPTGAVHVGGGQVNYSQLGLLVTAVAVVAVVFALFRFSDLGLAMRGAAQNRRAAALMGVNPNLTATAAWALAGATAGLAGVLLAGATVLDPYNLPLAVLPAFVAALLGGLESLPGILWGSLVVGVVIGMVPALAQVPVVGALSKQTGASQVFLVLVAFVVLGRRGQALVAGDIRAEGR